MTPDSTGGTGPGAPGDEEDLHLARLLEEAMARLERGEGVDPEALAGDDPLLAARLRACLGTLKLVERAVKPDGVMDASLSAELSGRAVGEFKIIRELGRGGMGLVYEAEQVSLRRRVALKILPLAAILDDRSVQRFKLEAQAAAQLQHPGIVPVFAVGSSEGIHYYAMLLVDGLTLEGAIAALRAGGRRAEVVSPEQREALEACGLLGQEGERPEVHFRAVARLGQQAAEALAYAHGEGILHRDIKPSNLLLDRRGRLWIGDFGLARLEGDATVTAPGDIVGTLLYMSPEQAMGRRGEVDRRSDIYSLGATLFELATLCPPRSVRNRPELLQQLERGDPPCARRARAEVPRDLETILLKAMARLPSERYDSAALLAQDLACFAQGLPIAARRPGAIRNAGRWIARHKLALVATTAVVLGIASLSALWAARASVERRERTARYEGLVLEGAMAVESALENLRLATPFYILHSSTDTQLGKDNLGLGGGRQRFEEARAKLSAAAATDPGRAEAYYHLARTLLALGRREEARKALLDSLEVEPGFPPAALLSSTLTTPSGRAPVAPPGGPAWIAPWIRARGAEDAARWADAALAHGEVLLILGAGKEPYSGLRLESLLGRGRALVLAGDLDGALLELGAARRIWPELLEPGVLVARIFVEKGDVARADVVFRELEALAGGSALPLRAAETYIELRRYGDALPWLDRVPPSSQRERLKARALSGLGRPAEAARLLEAIPGWEEDTDLLYAVGVSRDRAGEYGAAARAFEELLSRSPDAEAFVSATLGWTRLRGGDRAGAAAAFLRAAELEPDACGAFSGLERILRAQPEALELLGGRLLDRLEERLRSRPTAPGLVDLAATTAKLLLERGRAPEAIHLLETAIDQPGPAADRLRSLLVEARARAAPAPRGQ